MCGLTHGEEENDSGGGGGGIDGDTDRNASIIRKCFKKDDTRTTDMHTFTADAAHK